MTVLEKVKRLFLDDAWPDFRWLALLVNRQWVRLRVQRRHFPAVCELTLI